ncbi:MAG: hypothetical protein ISN26_00775 [Betaproteobacteria bacterium AqS2]|uniref:Uncharacterized protein n=1 Tax=Candidatus Amphirhobacter heronislandensis TaxID=1732024 RepID=A0A930UF47_9GAMM|nr:hypothetical protein [Betaproteobacteria bacterium AqS2]
MTILDRIPLCQLAVLAVLAGLAFAIDPQAGWASLLAGLLILPEAFYALGARAALAGPAEGRVSRAIRVRGLKLLASLALMLAGLKALSTMAADGSAAALGFAWLGTLTALALVPLLAGGLRAARS